MKTLQLSALSLCLAFTACKKETKTTPAADQAGHNKAMILFVNHQSHAFEGGKEFVYDSSETDMTVSYEHQAPGDFGHLKVHYNEMNAPLFEGTLVWMGTGERSFPEQIDNSDSFSSTDQEDIVYPANGFVNVLEAEYGESDPLPYWSQIQNLTKVRAYLQSNPGATVKYFVYRPSQGVGNPNEWSYVFLLKD